MSDTSDQWVDEFVKFWVETYNVEEPTDHEKFILSAFAYWLQLKLYLENIQERSQP